MRNNQILNMLSVLESEFYYRAEGSNDRENVSFQDCQEMHDQIDKLLKKWHEITGEVLR